MTSVPAWIAQSGVVQGIIIGATLAFLTAILIMNGVGRGLTTTVNGWRSIRKVGQPGNGVLVRAACSKALPAVNVFEEAAYWTTKKDGAGRTLTGGQDYVMHFPPGQLPPSAAFWSLTITDAVGYMVSNSSGHSSVNDRTDFARNSDGSIDLHIRHDPPSGNERNWLAAPSGRFKLTLRSYLPGAAVLDGAYHVPQVAQV